MISPTPKTYSFDLRTPQPATETQDSLTRNFDQKYPPKNPPGRNSQKIPRRYPSQTPPKNEPVLGGIFYVNFGVFFLRVPEFRPRFFFFFGMFVVESPGRAISGLCSRSGRSQLFTYLWTPTFMFSGVWALWTSLASWLSGAPSSPLLSRGAWHFPCAEDAVAAGGTLRATDSTTSSHTLATQNLK